MDQKKTMDVMPIVMIFQSSTLYGAFQKLFFTYNRLGSSDENQEEEKKKI